MLRNRFIAATLFSSLFVAAITHADPFDPKHVPADTKWLVHADLDAARDTKSFDLVKQNLLSDGDSQAKFGQIETVTGVRIPDDLHDVTVYGKEAGDEAGVILVHGKLDQIKITNALRLGDQFASNPFGNYAVMTWWDKDKGKTIFGAFRDGSNFIISQTEKNVENALDTADGTTEAIKADSPLASGAKPQLLLYVAAKDLPQLNAAGGKPNPVIQSIETAWISLSEKDDIVTLKAELAGTSAETAKSLQDSLNGLKGMITLAANGQNADPVAKAVATASKTFATTQSDKTVDVEWPITVDQVTTIVKAIADKRK